MEILFIKKKAIQRRKTKSIVKNYKNNQEIEMSKKPNGYIPISDNTQLNLQSL